MPDQQETMQNAAPAPKKKGVLGCSFPVFIVAIVVLLGVFVIGFLNGPIGKSLTGGEAPHPPEVELPAEVVFHILGFPITNSILGSWLTMLVLVLFSFIVTQRLKPVPGRWQALLEAALGGLLSFCQGIAGKENGRRFFPVIATIFLYVMFNGWLSLLPVFGSVFIHTAEGEAHLLRGANTDINTPLSIALFSFVSVWFFGIKDQKIHFIAQFINVGEFVGGLGKLARGKVGAGFKGLIMGIINMFIGLIELLSQFVRIISFTLRLFGNMTAGEILLVMATFLLPFLFADIFYTLEILVGLIQAVIFSVLTLIFMTLAVTSHEEHKHEEAAHH